MSIIMPENIKILLHVKYYLLVDRSYYDEQIINYSRYREKCPVKRNNCSENVYLSNLVKSSPSTTLVCL